MYSQTKNTSGGRLVLPSSNNKLAFGYTACYFWDVIKKNKVMRLLTDIPGEQACFPLRRGRKRGGKRKRTGYNSRDTPENHLTNTGHDYRDTILVVIECPWRIFIISPFPLVRGGNRTRNVDCSFKNVG